MDQQRGPLNLAPNQMVLENPDLEARGSYDSFEDLRTLRTLPTDRNREEEGREELNSKKRSRLRSKGETFSSLLAFGCEWMKKTINYRRGKGNKEREREGGKEEVEPVVTPTNQKPFMPLLFIMETKPREPESIKKSFELDLLDLEDN